jgi:hypothetical protein
MKRLELFVGYVPPQNYQFNSLIYQVTILSYIGLYAIWWRFFQCAYITVLFAFPPQCKANLVEILPMCLHNLTLASLSPSLMES